MNLNKTKIMFKEDNSVELENKNMEKVKEYIYSAQKIVLENEKLNFIIKNRNILIDLEGNKKIQIKLCAPCTVVERHFTFNTRTSQTPIYFAIRKRNVYLRFNIPRLSVLYVCITELKTRE